MNNTITIQPFTTIVTKIITSFKISCRTLNLFTNASFNVDSFDDSNNLISRQIVILTHEEYQQWKNDDSYITEIIANKLGYSKTV